MSEASDQLKLQMEPVRMMEIGSTHLTSTNSQKSSAMSNSFSLIFGLSFIPSHMFGFSEFFFDRDVKSTSFFETSRPRFSTRYLYLLLDSKAIFPRGLIPFSK